MALRVERDQVCQRMCKILEKNWSRIVDLEEELDEQGQQQQQPGPHGFPEKLLVCFGPKLFEFQLGDDELQGVQEVADLEEMVRENIQYHLGLHRAKQVYFDAKDVELKDLEAWSRVLCGGSRSATLKVEDVDNLPNGSRPQAFEDLATTRAPSELTGQRRILRVVARGQTHFWLDLDEPEHADLISSPDVDVVMRENLEHHFQVPADHQDVRDEFGVISSAADFRRVLGSASPIIKLYDRRQASEVLPQPTPHSEAATGSGSRSPGRPATTPGSPSSPSSQGGLGRTQALDYKYIPHFGTDFIRGGERRYHATRSSFSQSKPLGYSHGRVTVELKKERVVDKYGFNVKADTGGKYLIVGEVFDNGILARWNRANPVFSLKAGDIILSVNGCADSAPRMEGQLTLSSVKIEAQRTGAYMRH